MSIKNVTIVGNLTRDPEVHVFTSGKSIGKGSLAVNDRKFNKESGAWEDGDTTFFDLVVFESMMENFVTSLAKGDRVVAVGTLRVREYETKNDAGEVSGKGKALELLVDEIGPSLKWAQATVTKVKRTNGNGGPAPFGDEGDYNI